MKRSILVLMTLLTAAVQAGLTSATTPAPTPPPKPPAPAVLWWNNGETLPGEISKLSPTSITWISSLFENELELDRGVLFKVDRALTATAPSGLFRFQMRDGSQIFGDLVSIAADTVTVHSDRCGDLVLKRSELLNMRRLHGNNLVLAGPIGDVGWDSTPRQPASGDGTRPPPPPPPPAIPPLLTGPGGALDLPYWNRSAYLDVKLPERVDLEIHVRASKRPDFKLFLPVSPKQALSIETWDEDLVLRVGNQFKTIQKIADADHDLRLRLCWDTKTRQCTIYSPAGELLTDWKVPETPEIKNSANAASPTLQLQNKGRDLSLEFIRIRTWDGSPPPKFDTSRPRLELADGRIVAGEVSQGSPEGILLPSNGDAEDQSFPLDQVDAIVFSAERLQPKQPRASFSCNDGTFLMGRVVSIKDDAASIETSFVGTPITAHLDGLRQIRFRTDDANPLATGPSLDELDKIAIRQTTLHGKLTVAGDDQPRWLSVGALQPAIPSKSIPSEITRYFPAKATFPSVPALIYTKSGDILPGSLSSITASGVEMESPLVEVRKLPAANLNAIQLDPLLGRNLEGFEEAGWHVLKGNSETVKKDGQGLILQPATSIGHPFAMQGDDVQFSLKTSGGWCSLRLRTFCSGTDSTKAPAILLVFTGNQLYSGFEGSDGQFENQICTPISMGEYAVRLAIDNQGIELQVNGMPIQTLKVAASARRGDGLIIEPASAWGNEVNPVNLGSFSAHLSPGRPQLPGIAIDAKQQALTVPRFRKNNPPKHALIATNGDILRGEIAAMAGSSFDFRSGLDELRVKRDRVKAIVWLGKPVESSAPEASRAVESTVLDQTLDSHVRYPRADLPQLISYLQAQAPGLKFKLPEPDSRKLPFQFGGQSIRQTLDALCARFQLVWQLDGAGTIVLKPAPPPGNEPILRSYWLNADAFAGSASVKSVLEAKGVPFAEGATAFWNPDSRQLLVKNTPAAHAKLASLLATDFGGNASSPTHWLTLTNGACLGLIVDKFESDKVTGHHPVYGRCNIPFGEICSIRTSMPSSGAAYKALDSWRLVYAPEPTIPEAGGESSPMLGKTPKPFKLALLGGGDFDLAQQKGKIVVLDFWASWCGPCVKSLPSLIESMSAFPPDQVTFAGVNQAEPPEVVKRFLEVRGWKLTVALDVQQDVARQFGVDGIPHTVVIGRDGKIAWVKSGYDPDDEAGAAKMVKQLLSTPAPN